jgi:antibiotic biosynthesis monooxygenase (ABM) superfamily enzyme
VRPGCEAEFQQALREFLQTSFAHGGCREQACSCHLPTQTRANTASCARSPMRQSVMRSMTRRCSRRGRRGRERLTEGEPVYRQLHGLEAWFRSPHNPPPRWKMAVATFLGVFPVAMVLNLALGPVIVLAFVPATRLQPVRCDSFNLGGDAAGDARPARLAASSRKRIIKMNRSSSRRNSSRRCCGASRNSRRMCYDTQNNSGSDSSQWRITTLDPKYPEATSCHQGRRSWRGRRSLNADRTRR